ncbi:MAG: class I SAM-dependent methyltransferase [Phaeodactylibacter sp.]|nr:class I SAM-dependent methyltransferase [Phaeodactylibacter sp.]
MKPPFWKSLLSYLFEWHIESAPSEANPHLYVSLKNGRYQLCTANAVYSYEDLYTNFLWAFEHIQLDEVPGEDVLVLGLGLGSIPLILEKKFGRRYRYTAVELDESVVYLAGRYGLGQLSSPIATICADAYSFLLQNEEQYGMICMDIFLDDVVPRQFESPEFLEALKDALAPGGLLLYNRLADNPRDRRATQFFFERHFLSVFPQGAYLDVGGNWMLINHREALKRARRQ